MIKTKNHDSQIKTALRLPRELHAQLTDSAAANGRSLNAEIIARLRAEPVDLKLEELAKQNLEIKALARQILENVANR